MSGLIPTRPLLALAAAASLVAAGPATSSAPRHGATLSVALDCYGLGFNRMQCEALVDGGTSPYSFSWTPTPTAGGGSGGLAIIPCNNGQYRTVSVDVTDANNDTGSDSGSFYCGSPQ
jgi:hypothetical protein